MPSCIKKSDIINRLQNGYNLKDIDGVSIKDSNGNNLIDQTSTSLSVTCSAGKNANCISEIESALQTSDEFNAVFVASNKNYASVNQQTKIKNQC